MIQPETLHELVMANVVIPVKFHHQRFIVDGRGVLYWPQHDLLVFSDLHFEKGSFLSQFANPLPRFDTKETLKRMGELIDEYTPTHVICLGDSFHDMNAGKRMQSDDIDSINILIEKVKVWTWVLGNHDPEVPDCLRGERAPWFKQSGILFVHEPEDLAAHTSCEAQVFGHFHPKTSHKVSQRKLTGKSFLLGENMLIMPAFGKYTGGLSSEHDVIKSLFEGQGVQKLLCYNKKVFML